MSKLLKIGALACISSLAQAGTMGEEDSPPAFNVTPFIVGEASLNWIANKSLVVNNMISTQTNNIWGGRFGAGLTRSYREGFSFTGEVGYGYYGRVRYTFSNAANNGYFAVDGLDMLVGLIYNMKDVNLFFKAGGMVENMRIKESLDLTQATSGGVLSGTESINTSKTQVLPALKAGGYYNYNENVSLTLAYWHVFGSTPSAVISRSITTSPILVASSYKNIHDQAPSISSFMFGVQYNFT